MLPYTVSLINVFRLKENQRGALTKYVRSLFLKTSIFKVIYKKSIINYNQTNDFILYSFLIKLFSTNRFIGRW